MIKRKNGFTVIEILLGLTIFSFIALTLYNTFAGGVTLNRRSENLNRIYREARWSFDQMTRDLENMVPYDFANSYPDLLAFSGTEDEFTLTLPTDDGLKVVQYSLRKPDLGHIHKTVIGKTFSRNTKVTLKNIEEQQFENLVREEKSFLEYMTGIGKEDPEVDVLSSRVKEGGATFQYADIGEEGASTVSWSDEWTEKHLPAGVRIELTYINKNNNSPLTLRKDIFIPTRINLAATELQ